MMKYFKIAIAVLGYAGWMLQAQTCWAQDAVAASPVQEKNAPAADRFSVVIGIQNEDASLGRIQVGGSTYVQFRDSFAAGEEVTFRLSPNEICERFVCWSDGDSALTRSIIVDRDTVIEALFSPQTFAIQVNTKDSTITGTVRIGQKVGSSIKTNIQCGEEIWAIPDAYTRFVCWSDSMTDNPRIYDAKFSRLSACFVSKTTHLSVKTIGNGVVEIRRKTTKGKAFMQVCIASDTLLTLNAGDYIEAIAIPDTLHSFRCWEDNDTVPVHFIQLGLEGDTAQLCARFDKNTTTAKVVNMLNHLLILDSVWLAQQQYAFTADSVTWYLAQNTADILAYDETDDVIYKYASFSVALPKDTEFCEYYAVIQARDLIDSGRIVSLFTNVIPIGQRPHNPEPPQPSKQDSILQWQAENETYFPNLYNLADNPADSDTPKPGEITPMANTSQRKKIVIFPTIVPTGQPLTIQGLTDKQTYSIRIYDFLGRLVRQYSVHGEESLQIIAEQNTGTYTVCIEDGENHIALHYVANN